MLTFCVICITVQKGLTREENFEVKVRGGIIHEEFAKST
jgi:hypothetical protein